MKLFGTTGQKFHHCPGTKGQAKNLAKGRDGSGQPKSGTGRGTKRDRAEKDVLKLGRDNFYGSSNTCLYSRLNSRIDNKEFPFKIEFNPLRYPFQYV